MGMMNPMMMAAMNQQQQQQQANPNEDSAYGSYGGPMQPGECSFYLYKSLITSC